jgi:hypothetical protein
MPYRDAHGVVREGGRVDVVGWWPGGAPPAVEIDWRHKAKSLTKLKVARERGMRALWVRWDPGPEGDIDGIPMVRVDVTQNPKYSTNPSVLRH